LIKLIKSDSLGKLTLIENLFISQTSLSTAKLNVPQSLTFKHA